MAFWVYILRCADGACFTGHTDQLDAQLARHQAGDIPGCFTHQRRPLVLAWAQEFSTLTEALAAERQIKGWRQHRKQALIDGRITLERVVVAASDEVVSDPAREASDIRWMQHALALAERAQREHDEIPVGAVLVDAHDVAIGEGCNRNIAEHDPSAHAEIMALRAAGRQLGNHRMPDTTLYVTLEPCAMCAMAIVHARVRRLVFGASDPKTGACGSVFDLVVDSRHNHRVEVTPGVLAELAGQQLRDFFLHKRR